MHDIRDVDLIIIPSQGFFFDLQSEAHIARVDWLGKWSKNGADLASVCTGAFTAGSHRPAGRQKRDHPLGHGPTIQKDLSGCEAAH